MRWLSTVPAKAQVEPPEASKEPIEAQLAATETLESTEAHKEPIEAQLAATETLESTEARREPTEAQLAATNSLAPPEGPGEPEKPEDPAKLKEPEEPGEPEERKEPVELKEPREPAELKEPEEPGEPEEPKEPAELKEPEDPGGPEEPSKPGEPDEPEEDPGWGEWPPDGDSRPLPSREDRSRRCGAENAAEEDAVTALLEEEARENCEPELRRVVLTPENIAAVESRPAPSTRSKQLWKSREECGGHERVVQLLKVIPSEYGGKLRGLPRTPRWIPATA